MRIDKQLERNQGIREMKQRFHQVFGSFDTKDYENPITRASIQDSLTNIKRELNRVMR